MNKQRFEDFSDGVFAIGLSFFMPMVSYILYLILLGVGIKMYIKRINRMVK